eukprot:3295132-Rhodomonas_salina.8
MALWQYCCRRWRVRSSGNATSQVLSAYALATRCPVLIERIGPICLRARYAMSGSDLACAALGLRVWCTDLAYACFMCYVVSGRPMRCPGPQTYQTKTISSPSYSRSAMLLCACYALSGTDLPYAATGKSATASGHRRDHRRYPQATVLARAMRCPVLT